MIILPEKARRQFDPYISPVHGKHGPCALCSNYSDLTENHVPPQVVGNARRIIAKSYITSTTSNGDLVYGRKFPNGLKFRTICRDCNSKLGGSEDKAIGAMFERARKLVESPLILTRTMRLTVQPNLIYRGLLAHIASANDQGYPTDFDTDARNAFLGKTPLRECPWNLFYWVYQNDALFLQRRVFLGVFGRTTDLIPIYVLKYYPLGFLFTTLPMLGRLPNLKTFLQSRDESEAEIPLHLDLVDKSAVWPAVPGGNTVVFMGGDAFGLVGMKD